MAVRRAGSNAVLRIGLTPFSTSEDPTYTTLSTEQNGLAQVSVQSPEDKRTRPEYGGYQITTRLGYERPMIQFTVDDTTTTAPLLWGRAGRRFSYQLDLRGTGNGLPRLEGEAIADVTWMGQPSGRQFRVRLVGDGSMTASTQS